MTLKNMRMVSALVVIFGLAAHDAAAWGPKAQEAVMSITIQVVGRMYPTIFRGEDANLNKDILRGAQAGPEALGDSVSLRTDEEAFHTVGNEIQLLRTVKAYGLSHYFAYRMGVLCSLASDLVLPYALGTNPSDAKLKVLVDADIDTHVSQYHYLPGKDDRTLILTPSEYFQSLRSFFEDGRSMIALDYSEGKGYEGYLSQGAPTYFEKAVQVSADVWYTVLDSKKNASDVEVSRSALAWYFVKEIEYSLMVRKNQRDAEKVYANFERVNPNLGDAYETIGDLFYQFGAQDRGVAEWNNARSYPGPQRQRVSEKLRNHFYQLGLALLEKGKDPAAPEGTLTEAQEALEKSLQFDVDTAAVADQLSIVKRLIAEKDERRQTATNIIAGAEKVVKEAEQSAAAGQYANAIATYNSSVSLYEGIDTEFEALSKTAKDGIASVKRSINKIIVEVLDKAQDQIDQGERAIKENHFDEARQLYDGVERIVSVVPADESTTHGKQRKELIGKATDGKRKADDAEQRYKAAQQAAQDAAKQQGGAKAPAAATAPRKLGQ